MIYYHDIFKHYCMIWSWLQSEVFHVFLFNNMSFFFFSYTTCTPTMAG